MTQMVYGGRVSNAGGWLAVAAAVLGLATAAEAKLTVHSADPYVGAVAVDAGTGQVLIERNADAQAYPASVVKLMNLLIILEKVEQGQLSLSNTVTVTAEASRTGGSQVYLKEHETFTVDDLLYALMVQSGNDAAVALAIHVAGSKDAFVELMNQKAAQLGMSRTRYHSVHGLPPSAGQSPDVSTPRDLAVLARELVRRPDVLRYTATRERPFRNGTFIMRTHNHLLGSFPGCDGLKTGYFTAGGYSIVTTAQRNGQRVIAVVLGSKARLTRDASAAQLMTQGFQALPALPPPAPAAATNALPTNLPPAAAEETEEEQAGCTGCGRGWLIGGGVLALILVAGVAFALGRRTAPREL